MSSKILVGISGGVDSAYTLKLLKDKGYDVTGAYLIMTDDGADFSEAERCANEAKTDFVTIDCREDFRRVVIGDFLNEYANGRTPNPCVVCNRFIKINKLVEYAKEQGFDKVATGHYARITHLPNGNNELSMAVDLHKDQSYMLWRLTKEQLSYLEFPLGDITKAEVRKCAENTGLSAAKKKDSLDICFVPDGDYFGFLKKNGYSGLCGKFYHKDGRFLGNSRELANYTIGQRRGLSLAMDRSVFVTDIIPKENKVIVDYEEGIYTDSFDIENINFVSIGEDEKYTELFVKIRYAAKPAKCTVTKNGNMMTVYSDGEPFRAVTPGQSAVFYDKNKMVLFGGYITRKG